MQFIQSPRRTGKTTAAVAWLRRNPNGVLLVMNVREQERLHRENPDLDKHRFITVDSARQGALVGKLPRRLAIDNLDLILADWLHVAPHEIELTTWNAPPCPRRQCRGHFPHSRWRHWVGWTRR